MCEHAVFGPHDNGEEGKAEGGRMKHEYPPFGLTGEFSMRGEYDG